MGFSEVKACLCGWHVPLLTALVSVGSSWIQPALHGAMLCDSPFLKQPWKRHCQTQCFHILGSLSNRIPPHFPHEGSKLLQGALSLFSPLPPSFLFGAAGLLLCRAMHSPAQASACNCPHGSLVQLCLLQSLACCPPFQWNFHR